MIPSHAHIIGPEGEVTYAPGESAKPAVLRNALNGGTEQIAVLPGTSPRAIFRRFNLDESVATLRRAHQVIGIDENLYPLITPGEELIVSSRSEAGVFFDFVRVNLGLPLGQDLHALASKLHAVKQAPQIAPPPSLHTNKQATQLATAPAIIPLQPPVTIAPLALPHWQREGWEKRGNEYHGWCRCDCYAMRARIVAHPGGDIGSYVHKPPRQLKDHPHWICFHRARDGWYRIHWHIMPADVSAAIISIEHLLYESFHAAAA